MNASASSTATPPAPRPLHLLENLKAGRRQTVVCYGTSLTEGGAWVPQLREKLETLFPGLVDLHNGGLGGMNSDWGREHLDERVLIHRPDAVFIEFSVNDAVARFHLTPAAARSNLETMIDRILGARPGCEIILQVMNPVLDRPEGHDGWRPHLETYQDIHRSVARERGLILIDHMPAWLHLLRHDEPTFRRWVPDGLHPVEPGYSNLVSPEIRRVLGL